MFFGEFKHTCDIKGRIFIPAKYRTDLSGTFMLAKGIDKCICVYPMQEWEIFTDKIMQLPMTRMRKVRRYFNAGATECSLDSQGRIAVPQTLRDFAHIEKDVVVIGNKTHLEIWDSALWDNELVDNEEVTKELLELDF